jgi:hypothetical protein
MYLPGNVGEVAPKQREGNMNEIKNKNTEGNANLDQKGMIVGRLRFAGSFRQ